MIHRTLIDVATLQANLDSPGWCVFDVRHQLADVAYGRRVYAEGHLPGAVFLHCDDDLSGPKSSGNGRHPLPDPHIFAQKLAQCGVSANSQVVVYDDSQGMIAGRLWWMLRWLGHEAVAVLDGGIQAWQAAGGALTAETSTLEPGDIRVRSGVGTVDVAEVLKNLGSAELCVVDARSPDRFRGENETLDPVGGHIPGALNRFFRDNLCADGKFKAPELLRKEWRTVLGAAAPEQVVHQCGSGVSGCLNLLAMEHAGLTGSRLYPGSWSEWCADPVRPIAR